MGRWAGDEIVIVGDYDSSGLFEKADNTYKDISRAVREMILQDEYVASKYDPSYTIGSEGYSKKELAYIKRGKKAYGE